MREEAGTEKGFRPATAETGCESTSDLEAADEDPVILGTGIHGTWRQVPFCFSGGMIPAFGDTPASP
jgi:hypothetical protein